MKSFLTVLKGVAKYQTENPFDDELQGYLMEHLNKSIERFCHEPSLENTVKYRKEPPEWSIQWKSGKKILIDFSECEYFTRMFLFGFMIQLVNNMMPHTNEDRPQGLIIVEDGMEIFSKYLFNGSLEMIDGRREECDEILSKFVYFENTTLGYVFERWIGHELIYRNVSVVTVTSSLAEIFESIARYSELIFLFKLGKTDKNNYKYNPDIKEIVLSLPKHQALVLGSGAPFKLEIL